MEDEEKGNRKEGGKKRQSSQNIPLRLCHILLAFDSFRTTIIMIHSSTLLVLPNSTPSVNLISTLPNSYLRHCRKDQS